MNAVRVRKKLESHIIDLPEVSRMVGKTVEIIVLEEQDVPDAPPAPKAGSAKGLVTMSDDFDAPLADFDSYTR